MAYVVADGLVNDTSTKGYQQKLRLASKMSILGKNLEVEILCWLVCRMQLCVAIFFSYSYLIYYMSMSSDKAIYVISLLMKLSKLSFAYLIHS